MKANADTLAIILARGGSKGLPAKNLQPLNGKPLVTHTLLAVLNSESIARTVLSSDESDILEVGNSCGVETHRRTALNSSDSAKSEDALFEVLQDLAPPLPPLLVLLQPTSPLRTSQHIEGALALLRSREADCVLSVCEPDFHPLKCFLVSDDNVLSPILDITHPFLPRQSLPVATKPNGAIFAVKTELFLKTGKLFHLACLAYRMDIKSSIDIDSKEDIRKAESFLKKTK